MKQKFKRYQKMEFINEMTTFVNSLLQNRDQLRKWQNIKICFRPHNRDQLNININLKQQQESMMNLQKILSLYNQQRKDNQNNNLVFITCLQLLKYIKKMRFKEQKLLAIQIQLKQIKAQLFLKPMQQTIPSSSSLTLEKYDIKYGNRPYKMLFNRIKYSDIFRAINCQVKLLQNKLGLMNFLKSKGNNIMCVLYEQCFPQKISPISFQKIIDLSQINLQFKQTQLNNSNIQILNLTSKIEFLNNQIKKKEQEIIYLKKILPDKQNQLNQIFQQKQKQNKFKYISLQNQLRFKFQSENKRSTSNIFKIFLQIDQFMKFTSQTAQQVFSFLNQQELLNQQEHQKKQKENQLKTKYFEGSQIFIKSLNQSKDNFNNNFKIQDLPTNSYVQRIIRVKMKGIQNLFDLKLKLRQINTKIKHQNTQLQEVKNTTTQYQNLFRFSKNLQETVKDQQKIVNLQQQVSRLDKQLKKHKQSSETEAGKIFKKAFDYFRKKENGISSILKIQQSFQYKIDGDFKKIFNKIKQLQHNLQAQKHQSLFFKQNFKTMEFFKKQVEKYKNSLIQENNQKIRQIKRLNNQLLSQIQKYTQTKQSQQKKQLILKNFLNIFKIQGLNMAQFEDKHKKTLNELGKQKINIEQNYQQSSNSSDTSNSEQQIILGISRKHKNSSTSYKLQQISQEQENDQTFTELKRSPLIQFDQSDTINKILNNVEQSIFQIQKPEQDKKVAITSLRHLRMIQQIIKQIKYEYSSIIKQKNDLVYNKQKQLQQQRQMRQKLKQEKQKYQVSLEYLKQKAIKFQNICKDISQVANGRFTVLQDTSNLSKLISLQ